MTFRLFLSCIASCALLYSLPLTGLAKQPEHARRPNIVLILADDLGFSDLGCYGSEISTPNLDRLATNGLRFSQFYNTTRCCPTRASLLTGLYPHQAGIGHMMQDLGQPGYRGELNDRCVTIAEVLKNAGYHTAMSGKWHVSHIKFTGKPQLNFENNDPFWTNKNNWPLQRGFEEFFGTIHGVNSYFDPFALTRGNEPIKPEGTNFYYTDAITDNAANFIVKFSAEQKPFFLYVAYTAPHWPLQARPEDIKKYEGKYAGGWDQLREQRYRRLRELGIIDSNWPLSPRNREVPEWSNTPDKEWDAHRMAVYAAMVDRMDQNIGRLMQKLEDTKVADNTLVIFLSDNGACAENLQVAWYDVPTKTRDGRPIKASNKSHSVLAGPDDTWLSTGPSWANASNTPFRMFKHFTEEGGIATPFIAYWPGKIKKRGSITSEVGHVIDLLPTFVDVAGAEYPKSFGGRAITPVEGKSLVPLFSGKHLKERTLFWEHEGNRAVRSGKWKLVADHGKQWELYDLEHDRTELTNLASKEPQKVAELSAAYDSWAKRCGVIPWDEIRK